MLHHLFPSRLRRGAAGLCLLALLACFLPLPVRAAEEPAQEVINLLLVGQDRKDQETRARSDSIILCTFRPETKELLLTSFLRDLYVPIPGWGDNRINAAYAFGGIPLLGQTLEESFGVKPDGTIEVDFSQFSQIIDELGGVELELRQDEADHISLDTGTDVEAGLQQLNGVQALSYARIRRLDRDGDFSRTQRQRLVLERLLERYRDASFITVVKVLGKIIPMVTTDLSTREILSYAITLFPMLSGISVSTQRIPADGTYEDKVIDGMSVLVADLDSARQLLTETTTAG